MRLVLLTDEQPNLFEEELLPSHQSFFLRHEDDIINMIDDQTSGFWLRFVITFRSVLYKKGLIPLMDERRLFAEEAFIEMVNLLTDFPNRRAFGLKQLMTDIRMFYKYDYIVGQGTISLNQCLSLPGVQDSLKRLFGRAKDAPKKHVKFIPFTRLAASLIKCYEKWENAKPVYGLSNIPWFAPAQWYTSDAMPQPFIFEGYIKGTWGEELMTLLQFRTAEVVWWDNIEEMIITKKRSLSKKYPLTVLLNRSTPTGATCISPNGTFSSLFSKERPQNLPVLETDDDDDDDLYRKEDYVYIDGRPAAMTENESLFLNESIFPTHEFPEPTPTEQIIQPNQVSAEIHHHVADKSSDLASKFQAPKDNAPQTKGEPLHTGDEMWPFQDSANAKSTNQTQVRKEWEIKDEASGGLSYLDSQQSHASAEQGSEIGTVPQALNRRSDQIPAQPQWSEEDDLYGQSQNETHAQNLPDNGDYGQSTNSIFSHNTAKPWWARDDFQESQHPGVLPTVEPPVFIWPQNVTSQTGSSRKRNKETSNNTPNVANQPKTYPGSGQYQRRGIDRTYVHRLLTGNNRYPNDFGFYRAPEVMGNIPTQAMPRHIQARYYTPAIEYYMNDDYYHQPAQYGNHDFAESNDQRNLPSTSAQSWSVGKPNNEDARQAELVKQKNDTNNMFNKTRKQTATPNKNTRNKQTPQGNNNPWNLPYQHHFQPQFIPPVPTVETPFWTPPSHVRVATGNDLPTWVIPALQLHQQLARNLQPCTGQNFPQNNATYNWNTNPREPTK